MTKIVYNACYGGFSLSHEAIMRYAEIKGITLYLYTEKKYGYSHYYLCPPEEYDRISAEEQAKPVSPDRYERSNALYLSNSDFERNDPILVQVVEELGDKANGRCAKLRIAEVPAGTLYRIDEYDGFESVETKDSYEWSVA
jgi:hypothetical protein